MSLVSFLRRVTHRGTSVIGLAVVTIACGSDPTAPEVDDPFIRTDQDVYEVHIDRLDSAGSPWFFSLDVGFTYTNRSTEGTEIPVCQGPRPPLLAKWIEGRWEPVLEPVFALCGFGSITFNPGDEYVDALQITVYDPESAVGVEWEGGKVSGIYRLEWGVLSASGDLAPRANRVSNNFELRGSCEAEVDCPDL